MVQSKSTTKHAVMSCSMFFYHLKLFKRKNLEMQNTIREYTIPDYNIFTEWRPEQHFQRLDKYSNYLWEEFRLETWEEVIARTVDTLRHLSNDRLPFAEYQKMFDLMYRLEIMPSMRLLSMPWRAIERCNTVLYNCTSGLGDTLKAIAEAQYLSMSGSGVTWSVEKQNVNKIPAIKHQTGMMYYHVVEDTQIGWARATETLLKELARGNDLTIDYSRVRPLGEPLKTKGGYASGPDILIETHNFIRKTLKNAQGRNLRPIEMHDMFCYALESGISGGTRRSAGMCIFDATDTEILTCKYDGFWNHPEHKVRANANNSAVWGDDLSKDDIVDLTSQLFSTTGGEPGLFKRTNAIKTSPSWREFLHPENVSTNPCSEISMQPIPVDSEYIKGGGWQFCNLSTVNARYNDDFNSLYEKTKYATLIGDIQSLATNFDFLREGTKTICEKDRLLGVNLVGYATSPFVRNNPKLVEALRDYTVEIDLKFAEQFNVPRSAAITAVKPSGNHSVLCYTAPGANPIHAETQIRNVTVNRNSAMHHFLESQGVPRHDYPGRDYASMFSFPIDYPEGSVTLENTTAIDQLEMWKFHKIHWCQHNPSISITYTPDEIDAIRQWLYQNQDIIGGLAFFPKYESSYELLPIVSVSKERYDEFTKDYPTISWKYYRLYETAVDDRQQVAECAGGQCVIV